MAVFLFLVKQVKGRSYNLKHLRILKHLKENKCNQHDVSVPKSHQYPKITREAELQTTLSQKACGVDKPLCLPSRWLLLAWIFFFARPATLPALRHLLSLPFFTFFVGWVLPPTCRLAKAWLLRAYPQPLVCFSNSESASFPRCDHELDWLTHTLLSRLRTAQDLPALVGRAQRIFWVRDPRAHSSSYPHPLHWLACGLG